MAERMTFVVSISENRVDPSPGQAVYDIARHHRNKVSHEEVIKVLSEHFDDWVVTVIPT